MRWWKGRRGPCCTHAAAAARPGRGRWRVDGVGRAGGVGLLMVVVVVVCQVVLGPARQRRCGELGSCLGCWIGEQGRAAGGWGAIAEGLRRRPASAAGAGVVLGGHRVSRCRCRIAVGRCITPGARGARGGRSRRRRAAAARLRGATRRRGGAALEGRRCGWRRRRAGRVLESARAAVHQLPAGLEGAARACCGRRHGRRGRRVRSPSQRALRAGALPDSASCAGARLLLRSTVQHRDAAAVAAAVPVRRRGAARRRRRRRVRVRSEG